jgi:hypothetical protein
MNAFEGTGLAAPAWTRAAGAPGTGEADGGAAAGREAIRWSSCGASAGRARLSALT